MALDLIPRSATTRALLGIALAGAGLGVRVSMWRRASPRARPPAQLALSPSAAATLPEGHGLPPNRTWAAHGVVHSQIGGHDEPVGTRFSRAWFVFTRCVDRVCTPWLGRDAKYGWEYAQLTPRGGDYRALFTIRSDACRAGGLGGLERSFVISLDRTRRHLRAVKTIGIYDGCGPERRDGPHLQLAVMAWADWTYPSCGGIPDCRQSVTVASDPATRPQP